MLQKTQLPQKRVQMYDYFMELQTAKHQFSLKDYKEVIINA